MTVRAASRSAGLNARYFYESFATPDELLLALFKREFGHLAIRLAPAFLAHAQGDETALRQAIEIVLTHLQEDPARANVLFTDGIGGASLRLERHQTLAELGALMSIESRSSGGVTDPVVAEVLASLFSGSMAVLAQRWCSGELGDDPGRVADVAATLVIGMVTKAAAYQPTS